MGEAFADGSLNSSDFTALVEIEVTTKYHAAWTLFAETKRGLSPIGLILGFYPHPDQAFSAYMLVGGIVWFPWASVRNKIESAVNFFNRIRNEIPMMGFAEMDHKKMYEVICRHGIMRRIGTSMNVFPGKQVSMFETRVTQ